MGHCFSDVLTPFISEPTRVVVVNVEVAVADMSTWGLITPGFAFKLKKYFRVLPRFV
jgi:hypothetical protein